ncbi:protease SohB [Hahella sp. SMD15-11]|uniref:Protease SohB n=1 Tax=Thermohahella caldifontis TaxID=3142973 RepID=A0AB39UYF4_9GAMM
MEFLSEYGLFLAKVVTFVAAIAVVIAMIVASRREQGASKKGHIEVEDLNERFRETRQAMEEAMLSEEEARRKRKEESKAKKKARKKKDKPDDEAEKPRAWVLDFDGDIQASDVARLRECITAVLGVAKAGDEVVVRLESPGGVVHGYGLAASQLERIRQRNIPLTVCVDKVAASGGYLMSCLADKLVAAPFAIVGSIGVVAQLPNFHRLLKKHDIDYEIFTAGKYKRTVTLFGENTEEGKRKFQQDLEDTHALFKEFVHRYRPAVDIEAVSQGDIWYGVRALEKGLIDEIKTSDDYILELASTHKVFHVDWVEKKSLPERLGLGLAAFVDQGVTSVLRRWPGHGA